MYIKKLERHLNTCRVFRDRVRDLVNRGWLEKDFLDRMNSCVSHVTYLYRMEQIRTHMKNKFGRLGK